MQNVYINKPVQF